MVLRRCWIFDIVCNDVQVHTVYPRKYAHGFVVLCFVVLMQSFIMNSPEVFIHIHQGCFAGTGAIVRLPQCQWSKPDGYGEISQCITTTKHSKAKTVCIFLGTYCTYVLTIYFTIMIICMTESLYWCGIANIQIPFWYKYNNNWYIYGTIQYQFWGVSL